MYFQFLQTYMNFSTNSSDMDVTVSRLHLSAVQKYKSYVYDTKLAELNDNLIHLYACTFSNYQGVFDP
jgi:hypothetical protein